MGTKYVLVAVDGYSKRIGLQQMGKISASSAARSFALILSRWPFDVRAVLSDHGTEVHVREYHIVCVYDL